MLLAGFSVFIAAGIFGFALSRGGDDSERDGPHGPGAGFRPCGSTEVWYHTSPLGSSADDIASIEPLGHIFVPGHTWPSDHIYINLPPSATSLPVRAPGAVRVWELSELTHRYVGGPLYTDYTLRFSPCAELEGYFHHVRKLVNPELVALASAPFENCSEFTAENGEYQKYCSRQIKVDVPEGEILGEVGGPLSMTFDFGAYDTRIPPLAFVNPRRFSESDRPSWDYLRTVCPLDAFESTLRSALSKKISRTAAPVCGTIMQDLAGTAQGSWASAGYKSPSDISNQLALVHDNFDPTFAVLATGGGPVGIHYLRFKPKSDGLVDRDFLSVIYKVGDNPIYCYNLPPGNDQGGRVILQMTSATALKAELQQGQCSASGYSFSSMAVVYER